MACLSLLTLANGKYVLLYVTEQTPTIAVCDAYAIGVKSNVFRMADCQPIMRQFDVVRYMTNNNNHFSVLIHISVSFR